MDTPWLISYIVLWLIVLALCLLVLLLYRQLGIMYLGSAEGVSRDGLDRGTTAPDFALTDQYGNSQRLSDYRGRPVVLLFGSPHCTPCRTLMPQLHEWATAHPDVGVVWLNAASEEESLKFVSELGATLPVAPYTPESKLMDRYKVRVTPFMFLLDERGVVRAKGLANTKSGLDLYYKELRGGGAGSGQSHDHEHEHEHEHEQSVAQQV
ncbi:MAG TPA: TlpA disulfide reductase family protein [Chloroflexia bacterium]|nr:TlpA disulfide reductase family protein [Chloroflexia bacterium]